MIIRNGIRSTLRARGRSLLFTLLIFVLTLAMTLGLGATLDKGHEEGGSAYANAGCGGCARKRSRRTSGQ